MIVDPAAPFRLSLVGSFKLGSLRMGVKADAVLVFPRLATEFEDLRFDTADDVETLDEYDTDEGDVSGTGDRW